MNYNEFFTQNAHQAYEKFQSNPSMKEVYEFLTKPRNIGKMIHASENDRPALEGVVQELEAKFPPTLQFDFEKNDHLRQTIGRMVKYIIGFYGYEVNKNIPIENPGYFKTATNYKFEN